MCDYQGKISLDLTSSSRPGCDLFLRVKASLSPAPPPSHAVPSLISAHFIFSFCCVLVGMFVSEFHTRITLFPGPCGPSPFQRLKNHKGAKTLPPNSYDKLKRKEAAEQTPTVGHPNHSVPHSRERCCFLFQWQYSPPLYLNLQVLNNKCKYNANLYSVLSLLFGGA